MGAAQPPFTLLVSPWPKIVVVVDGLALGSHLADQQSQAYIYEYLEYLLLCRKSIYNQ